MQCVSFSYCHIPLQYLLLLSHSPPVPSPIVIFPSSPFSYCHIPLQSLLLLSYSPPVPFVLSASWKLLNLPMARLQLKCDGDAQEGKWRGNWRLEWAASTLHTASEHGVSNITTADAHTLAASSRLNWRPCRFKWTGTFCQKTKSGFCACAITFQLASTALLLLTTSLSALVQDERRTPEERAVQFAGDVEGRSVWSIILKMHTVD
jgi:hypothetical protein